MLALVHCRQWTSDVMLKFSKFDLTKKQTQTSWMASWRNNIKLKNYWLFLLSFLFACHGFLLLYHTNLFDVGIDILLAEFLVMLYMLLARCTVFFFASYYYLHRELFFRITFRFICILPNFFLHCKIKVNVFVKQACQWPAYNRDAQSKLMTFRDRKSVV